MLCKCGKASACRIAILLLHKRLHLEGEAETESESESGREGEPLSVERERSGYTEKAELKKGSRALTKGRM